MGTQTVNSVEARQRLSEFLERVQNQGTMVRILCKKEPMAWLVGDNFMQSMGTLVEHIIDHKPALADMLALSLDAEIRDVIDQGSGEYKAGKKMPLDRILEVTRYRIWPLEEYMAMLYDAHICRPQSKPP